LLPVVIYAVAGSLSPSSESSSSDHPNAQDKPSAVSATGSKKSLAMLTATALAAASASYGSNTAIALGLSYALVGGTGILLVEQARWLAQNSRSSVIYSANGFLAQPEDLQSSDGTSSVVRDVCAAAGFATLLASVALESWHFGGLVYNAYAGHSVSGNWVSRHGYLGFAISIGVLLAHMLMYYSLLLMVSRLPECAACFHCTAPSSSWPSPSISP
jgi:hypothetical protein